MGRFLVLTIFLLLIMSTVNATYNITCERDCEILGNVSCSNESQTIGEKKSLLIPNFEYNNNQTYRMQFLQIGLPEQNNTIKCLIELNRTTNSNWSESIELGINLTSQVLNSSNTYFNGAFCQQGGYVDNEICFDNKTTKNFQYIVYSSNDGSCTGTQLYQNLGDNDGCAYSINVSGGSQDIYYYTEHWNYATGINCWDTTNRKFGNPFTRTLLECEIPCETTSQFAILLNHVENNPGSQPANYVYFNATEKRIDCESDYDYCSLFGQPYNNSLTYGCECPPTQFNLGITCDNEYCERSCSGTSEEINNYYINFSNTLQEALTSNNPEQSIEFFGNQAVNVFSAISPGLNIIVWLVAFGVIILMGLFVFAKIIGK